MFCNDNFHKLKRIKGKVFLDRDADIFKMIIIFLRSGQKLPHIEDNFQRNLFEYELDYWNLPPLYSAMKKLQYIFDHEPEQIEQACLSTWKQLGPFNLLKLISEKKIFIDEKLKLS